MIKFLKSMAIPTAALVALPGIASASVGLEPNDFVGISFWVISMCMVAATAFFFLETNNVSGKWKTSLALGGLVCLVAAVHYFYMREVWVTTGATPTVYRYVDWLITVPLQMIEFYIILAAVATVSAGIFWRLLIGTLIMLIGGFLGESGMILSPTVGFVVGMAGWIYILYEIFAGEAAQANTSSNSEAQKSAFNAMKWIVSVGWSIYPIGYFLGYFMGNTDVAAVNAVYNLADFINKIAFGLVIWAAASSESHAKT